MEHVARCVYPRRALETSAFIARSCKSGHAGGQGRGFGQRGGRSLARSAFRRGLIFVLGGGRG